MSMVKARPVSWPQTTSSDSNDFILEALTPLDVIVDESGAVGSGCEARGGAYNFWTSLVTPRAGTYVCGIRIDPANHI